jgi:hypothetical protein
MKRFSMFFLLGTVLLVNPTRVLALDTRLPMPPPDFFVELAKTNLPPGKNCCNKLRGMLIDTVVIPPKIVAALFKSGQLMLGDTRIRQRYNKGHIFGAICLPFNEVDYMKLKPLNVPIALF